MAEASQTPDTDGTDKRSDHKTRRPHRKSRYGCTKCKERRVKCDELTPRCSRCQKTNLVCQYPKRQRTVLAPEDSWFDQIDPSLLLFELSGATSGIETGGRSSPDSFSGHSPSAASRSPLSSSAPSSFFTIPNQGGKRLESPLRSQVAQTLAPAEFDLLKHYLEHTCKDLTVDPADQYTLQIGIPNLACQSKPLMRSVLALAAICRCCDIINQPSVSIEEHGQVLEFLTLADQYHMESLREIQASLPDAKHYDCILANAAMMGMYGSGSHRTRIWLTKTAGFCDQSLYDFMPKQLQWMSLWRAVDLAYMGILNGTPGQTHDMMHSGIQSRSSPSQTPPEFTLGGSTSHPQYEFKITPSRVERFRSPMTNHALYPILAGTVGSALAKLRETAGEIAMLHASQKDMAASGGLYDPDSPAFSSYSIDLALQSCFTALSILGNVVSETFPSNNATAAAPNRPSHLTFDVEIDPSGRLSEVSPWIRRYAASITSMIPTKLPRRMIPAFIHKVPTAYLELVSEMVSYLTTGMPPPQQQPDGGDNHDMGMQLEMSLNMLSWGAAAPSTQYNSSHSRSAEPSLAHQLALEIFAYWLVLMLLLDNVWWIGDLGAWELGRIVEFRKSIIQQQHGGGVENRPMMAVWSKEGDWWPESMYEVSCQFEKYKTRGVPSLGRDH